MNSARLSLAMAAQWLSMIVPLRVIGLAAKKVSAANPANKNANAVLFMI
jgi:hypothetical protein